MVNHIVIYKGIKLTWCTPQTYTVLYIVVSQFKKERGRKKQTNKQEYYKYKKLPGKGKDNRKIGNHPLTNMISKLASMRKGEDK